MKKKSSWLIPLVIIFFYIIGRTYKSWEESDVMSEGVRDTAFVNDIYSVKGSRYFEYQYDVNGSIYHGHRNKAEIWTRNGEFVQWRKLKLGDSIVIMYKNQNHRSRFLLIFYTERKKGINA
jgi:hypothetical protein